MISSFCVELKNVLSFQPIKESTFFPNYKEITECF
nr:MAG TPA: hypothetical protein [Caudoviricetes sp.]